MSPKIVCAHGWKYEPQWLVDDLHKNLSWVDDFAVVDCRGRTDELWIDERHLYAQERKIAGKLGADWILVVSPDERLEIGAEEIIRKAISGPRDRCYKLPVREMYTPTAYRSDGNWAKRVQARLYPYDPTFIFDQKSLHNNIAPRHPILKKLVLDVNLYHLKHIEPENRTTRVKVFEKLDPKHKFQRIGYEYLDNVDNLEMTAIPEGREFKPPYTQPYIFSPPEELYE